LGWLGSHTVSPSALLLPTTQQVQRAKQTWSALTDTSAYGEVLPVPSEAQQLPAGRWQSLLLRSQVPSGPAVLTETPPALPGHITTFCAFSFPCRASEVPLAVHLSHCTRVSPAMFTCVSVGLGKEQVFSK
jgi:hypothetical protein